MKRLSILLLALLLAWPMGACAFAPAIGVTMPKALRTVTLYDRTDGELLALGEYAAGVDLTALGEEDDWLRVRIGRGAGSIEGWMLDSTVGIGILPQEVPTGIALATVAPQGGTQAVAEPATGDVRVLGMLPQGAVVEVLGSVAGFAHIRVDTQTYGFVPEEALARTGALSQPDTRQPRRAYGVVMAPVAGERVPVYAFAQQGADTQLLAADLTGLEVLGGSDQWLQVRQYGVVGFMQADYVATYALEDYEAAQYARGSYKVGEDEDLQAGLYTFIAAKAGDTLDVYTAADTHRRYAPGGAAYYALYLPDGAVVTMTGGTLRTASATVGGIPGEDWRWQAQGRYLVGRDLPEGRYTVTPDPGAEAAVYSVSNLRAEESGKPDAWYLQPGTSATLLLQHGTFVELDGCALTLER